MSKPATNPNVRRVHTRRAAPALAVFAIPFFLGCATEGGFDGAAGTDVSGSWGTAQRIDADERAAYCPALAVNANGDAIAAWTGSTVSRTARIANNYAHRLGWGAPERIADVDLRGRSNSLCPSLAIDSERRALALWWRSEDDDEGIWSNRYEPDVGWAPSERVDSGLRNGSGLALALDPNGNATAVWRQTDDWQSDIWTNYYDAENGWRIAQRIFADDIRSDARSTDIAVDSNGEATVVWGRSVDGGTQVWAMRRSSTEVWDGGERIDRDDAPMAWIRPEVGVDGVGDAIALWCKSVNRRFEVWSNRYERGHGWGTAELIDSVDVAPSEPCRLAVSSNGDAMAVWHEGALSVVAKRYTRSGGWEVAQRISEGATNIFAKVAMDPSGNAMVAWLGTDEVRSNHYAPGIGWAGVRNVNGDQERSLADTLRLEMDAAGNAIAVWAGYGAFANTFMGTE